MISKTPRGQLQIALVNQQFQDSKTLFTIINEKDKHKI